MKIERVKELLVYDELTLSEIAYRLGYSSVAHLSAQFRRVTGLTPSSYKRLGDRKRRSLDEVCNASVPDRRSFGAFIEHRAKKRNAFLKIL